MGEEPWKGPSEEADCALAWAGMKGGNCSLYKGGNKIQNKPGLLCGFVERVTLVGSDCVYLAQSFLISVSETYYVNCRVLVWVNLGPSF